MVGEDRGGTLGEGTALSLEETRMNIKVKSKEQNDVVNSNLLCSGGSPPPSYYSMSLLHF
jgi:hypothetical protein